VLVEAGVVEAGVVEAGVVEAGVVEAEVLPVEAEAEAEVEVEVGAEAVLEGSFLLVLFFFRLFCSSFEQSMQAGYPQSSLKYTPCLAIRVVGSQHGLHPDASHGKSSDLGNGGALWSRGLCHDTGEQKGPL
jgi:hypothetical protein